MSIIFFFKCGNRSAFVYRCQSVFERLLSSHCSGYLQMVNLSSLLLYAGSERKALELGRGMGLFRQVPYPIPPVSC